MDKVGENARRAMICAAVRASAFIGRGVQIREICTAGRLLTLGMQRPRRDTSVMGEGVHELERLTARQLQQLIEGGTSTAVVPFGSVEHHGGHLPLGADAILADAVGAEVARRLGAVLAPTVRVGCSDRHSHLPGTLTLGPETLTRLAIEHARALARHGFTLIVLLSAHGGNQPAWTRP